ncbi:hypothetical protein KQY30_19975 [Streptomyces sp. GMY02]|uniref:hypothetical protein n=1 Tax=Streptomyces sp. GMY02 TaxID=1333528 RepID=UPI001C2BB79B|nr:hypothetical protein [Streptomyces sp. GMY02]QXE36179.1 hypothetical protein KQY30_19975 [Streptomyces sp. GMY02]
MTHTTAPNPAALGAEIASHILASVPGLAGRIDQAEFAGLTADLLVKHGLVPPPAMEQPVPDAACTAYDWCTKTGAHDLCWSKLTALPSVDGYGEHTLPVGLHAVPGEAPQVGFLDLDLTAAQARQRAREITRHMGEVLLLADVAEGVGPLEPDAECYSVQAGNAGGKILNAELYTTDEENPADRVTRIAVWSYQGDDDLTPEQAGELVESLEDFLPGLRALRDRAAELNAARGRA